MKKKTLIFMIQLKLNLITKAFNMTMKILLIRMKQKVLLISNSQRIWLNCIHDDIHMEGRKFMRER